MIEKIEVNENGDYKIKYNGKIVRCHSIVEIYKTNDDLSERLNPNIIAELESDNAIHTEYVIPVLSFEQLRDIMLNELQAKRKDTFESDDSTFSVDDILLFSVMMTVPDNEVTQMLPIETDNGYIIDSVKKLKDLRKDYLTHLKTYSKKIVDCKKAKTKIDLDKITL